MCFKLRSKNLGKYFLRGIIWWRRCHLMKPYNTKNNIQNQVSRLMGTSTRIFHLEITIGHYNSYYFIYILLDYLSCSSESLLHLSLMYMEIVSFSSRPRRNEQNKLWHYSKLFHLQYKQVWLSCTINKIWKKNKITSAKPSYWVIPLIWTQNF